MNKPMTNDPANFYARLQSSIDADTRRYKAERDELRAQLREEQQLHVQTLNERDAIRFASITLKNSKGRFHTQQAAERLFKLLP